jgi:hypothetical protein
VLVLVFVKVNVGVRQTVVTVLVYVNFTVLSHCAPKSTDAQGDDHDRDAKLEPSTHTFRNRDPQRQHDDADDQQRRCVSSAPKRTDERGTEDILVSAHNRRYRDDVIDFRCVF